MELNNWEFNWVSKFYNSYERCILEANDRENLITSTIKSTHNHIYREIEYFIKTTPTWDVSSFKITCVSNGSTYSVAALRALDNWTVNGRTREDFKNCLDIDISLTPFTNALPIKRLDLKLNKPHHIDVLYVDLLQKNVRVARQQYTKRSATEYNFQNIPNDFEADIIVDNDGFVVHYPELFERIEA